MRLANGLDVGADAAVVDQVDRRLQDRVDELGRRHCVGRDCERFFDLGSQCDRFGAARVQSSTSRDQARVVVGPG